MTVYLAAVCLSTCSNPSGTG